MLDRDLVDIDLELFGDQHRQRRVSPLAHLDHGADERHLARAVDAQEGVGRERRVSGKRVADLAARRQTEAEEQTTADGAGGGEEVSRCSSQTSVSATPAAFLIAARMRG